MKKIQLHLFFIFTILAYISCTNGKQQDLESLNKQVDSLLQENAQKDFDLRAMKSFVEVMAEGLDSISQQENLVFSNKGKEGITVDINQLKKNLDMFEKTLSEQKRRISQMTDSLKARGVKINKLNTLVNYLYKQLEEKDNHIKTLREDLKKKNVNITDLQNKVKTLNENNDVLTEKMEKQKEVLALQTEIVNEGYVLVSTKKELSKLGVVSSGFLKKTKINLEVIKKTQFKKVDIRYFKELKIDSKSPKMLTQMPASSYRFEKNGSTSTLYILDPTAFWSISNYLIIQIK